MASEAIKQMFLRNMLAQGEKTAQRKRDEERYQQIAQMAPDLVGSQGQAANPYQQSPDELFPGEAPIPGLTNVDQEAVPGTGLYDQSVSPQERFIAYNQRLQESAMPSLQKQALAGLSSMQGEAMPSTAPRAEAKTFLIGVGDGKVQRAAWDGAGGVKRLGEPFNSRNPYLDQADQYIDPDTGKVVKKNLTEAELRKKEGVDIQNRLSEYSMNVAKGEAGLEQVDFMDEQLDNLANTATGWSTGFGSFFKAVPTSDANKWDTMKTGVLAGLGLDKIAEMKSQSSTGATGMGALNEKELDLLVSYRGKLEQANTPEEIKRVIGRMKRLLDNSRKRTVARLAREETWFKKQTDRFGSDPYLAPANPTKYSDQQQPPPPQPRQKAEEGVIYQDAQGNKMQYVNGKWAQQ